MVRIACESLVIAIEPSYSQPKIVGVYGVRGQQAYAS